MVVDQIKYYPDRFYLRLEQLDLNKLGEFKFYKDLDLEHFAFIHEYYHYLNNIHTFSGVRQFHLNFCDRFRIINNFTHNFGIEAFPISTNTIENCQKDKEYYNKVNKTIHIDDVDLTLSSNIGSDNFTITDIICESEDILNLGGRYFSRVKLDTGGFQSSFRLNYGVLDELFCSLVDEYLYRNEFINDDVSFIKQRPTYPYQLHEKLFNYYFLRDLSIEERLLIISHSLNDYNPSLKLIQILEAVSKQKEEFKKQPFNFLKNSCPTNAKIFELLGAIQKFVFETHKLGRILISKAMQYYLDIFFIAALLKENDPYFFIRPFLVKNDKISFIDSFQRIYKIFNPPLLLQDKKFYILDNITDFASSTLLIIGIYEIFESLNSQKFAQRPKYLLSKYFLNDENDDDFQLFRKEKPMDGRIFQLALNELSLYKLYSDEKKFG